MRFIAHAMEDLMRDCAPGVDESRWVVVRLGVELPPPREGPTPANDPPVVLFAARFDPEKRHATLLDAVAALVRDGERLELWLAGSGRLLPDSEARARELGLEGTVDFLGYVRNTEILGWLEAGRVDVVALPSDSEGVPVSLIEALAYGVPAVASDVGGVAELVGGGCGLLVQEGDPEASPTGSAACCGRLSCGRRSPVPAARASRTSSPSSASSRSCVGSLDSRLRGGCRRVARRERGPENSKRGLPAEPDGKRHGVRQRALPVVCGVCEDIEVGERVEGAELGHVQPVVRDAGGVRQRMGIQVVAGPAERRPVEVEARRKRLRTGVEGRGCSRRRRARRLREVVQAEERRDPAVQHMGRRIGRVLLQHRPLAGGHDEQRLRLQQLLHRPVGGLEDLRAAEELCAAGTSKLAASPCASDEYQGASSGNVCGIAKR